MRKLPCDAFVLVHRVFIGGQRKPGGLDLTLDILKRRGWRYGLVEHPLDARGPSVVRYCSATTDQVLVQGLQWCRWATFRWALEPFWTVWRILRHFAWHTKTVALVADPLNAVAGLLLRRLRTARAIGFHVADFSTRRFNRPWLDRGYLALYPLAARRADVTTVVSQRIAEYTQQLRGVRPDQVLRLPNSTLVGTVPWRPISERRPASLILVAGTVSSWVGVEPMLESISRARQLVPALRLSIVGGFQQPEEASRLAAQIRRWGLEPAVQQTGFLPQADALALVASSWIGIAWYDEGSAWSYYCDSMKIWEYAACGLPVIANSLVGTADELRRAGGARLADDPESMASAINDLCGNPSRYAEMAQRARAWAEAHDKERLVTALAERLRPSGGGGR